MNKGIKCSVCQQYEHIDLTQHGTCIDCLDTLVRNGVLFHPTALFPLQVCKCGKWFSSTCRLLSFGYQCQPVIFGTDPVENRRLMLAAPLQANDHGLL